MERLHNLSITYHQYIQIFLEPDISDQKHISRHSVTKLCREYFSICRRAAQVECSEVAVEDTLCNLHGIPAFRLTNQVRETDGRRSIFEFARCFISGFVSGFSLHNETSSIAER